MHWEVRLANHDSGYRIPVSRSLGCTVSEGSPGSGGRSTSYLASASQLGSKFNDLDFRRARCVAATPCLAIDEPVTGGASADEEAASRAKRAGLLVYALKRQHDHGRLETVHSCKQKLERDITIPQPTLEVI